MMNKMKHVCMTAALLTAFSCAAALPVQAVSAAEEQTKTDAEPRITGGAILRKEPFITTYALGEQPDVSGAVVSGSGTVVQGTEVLLYWDIFDVPLESQKLDFSEVNITKPGTYPVYLVIEDVTSGAEPLRIEITQLTYVDDGTDFTNLGFTKDRLYFELGEPLDVEYVALTTTGRKDGKSWSVKNESLAGFMEYVDASAFDSSKTGEYEIPVTVGGRTEVITASVLEIIERITGDWNHDDMVTVIDAQSVLNVYVQTLADNAPKLNAQQQHAADVNEDGSVDAVDAQLILNYYVQSNIAGIPTEWEDLIKHEK